jgi:Sucrose synthase
LGHLQVLAELGGKPDLIIGNYSDGNLVGALMAARLNTTLATIAHALEKTKYNDADIHVRVQPALSFEGTWCFVGQSPSQNIIAPGCPRGMVASMILPLGRLPSLKALPLGLSPRHQ